MGRLGITARRTDPAGLGPIRHSVSTVTWAGKPGATRRTADCGASVAGVSLSEDFDPTHRRACKRCVGG